MAKKHTAARVNIEITLSVQPSQPQIQMFSIPQDARVVWYTQNNKLRFAYQICGAFWTPRFKELQKFADYYGTKAYKPLSEYMKAEVVELVRVCL